MIFRFANPAMLFLLVFPLLGWAAMVFSPNWRTAPPTVRFSDSRLLADLPSSWRVRLLRIPDILRLLIWILLVFVLARPQSGRQQDVIRGQGIDIVLALDISSSMEANDIPPSRLDGAKAQIERFIQGRSFDRVGLVVFAADAFHYVPPTLDYNVLINRLRDVQLVTAYNLDNGTAIGTGIASSANMLRRSDASSRVIILLTDGSSNRGNVNPLDAARAAAALDIRVYTIGMGRVATINGQTGDFDEQVLQDIARLTDGLYFRAEDIAGLQRTYEQIDALERTDIEQQVFVQWKEQSVWLMVAALVLMIAERVLRQTIFRAIP